MKKYVLISIFLILMSVCAKADDWDYYGTKNVKKYPAYRIEQPDINANFYLSPRLGLSYLTFDDISEAVGFTGGLSAGVYVNNFRFEAEINKHLKRRRNSGTKFEQTDLFLNAFYDFKTPLSTPFIGVGLGRLSLKTNSNEWWRYVSEKNTAWALSLTVGVSRAVTSNIAFEGMGRLKYANMPDPSSPSFLSDSETEAAYFNLELLAGLRFSF